METTSTRTSLPTLEPTVHNMAFFKKPQYSSVIEKKKDIPKDLYTPCPITKEILYTKDLENNLMVVPKSGYHFPLPALRRVESLLDEGSFEECDADLRSIDMLNFRGAAAYRDKLARDEKRTGMKDAVICGTGTMEGVEVSLSVMDFSFLGGSMGSVVGEKITRAIERSVELKCPCIIVSSSGGARMYEGIFSLMQMAKTSAALGRLDEAKLPFISVLANPTSGGVTASFSTLGDVILAEPGALICFAGPRVIKETTNEELPEGFQTSEFLLAAGLIDQIVSRLELRNRIVTLLHAFGFKSEAGSVSTKSGTVAKSHGGSASGDKKATKTRKTAASSGEKKAAAAS